VHRLPKITPLIGHGHAQGELALLEKPWRVVAEALLDARTPVSAATSEGEGRLLDRRNLPARG